MRIFDLVLSILLITCVAVTVYYIFKARVDYDITATKYSLESYVTGLRISSAIL